MKGRQAIQTRASLQSAMKAMTTPTTIPTTTWISVEIRVPVIFYYVFYNYFVLSHDFITPLVYISVKTKLDVL